MAGSDIYEDKCKKIMEVILDSQVLDDDDLFEVAVPLQLIKDIAKIASGEDL